MWDIAVITSHILVSPYFIDCFSHGKAGQHGSKPLVSLYAEDDGEVFFSVAVAEETVITDLLETGWEHMHHKAAYELLIGKCHLLEGRIIFVILCGKGDGIWRDLFDPGIRDGDTVGIPAKVFNGIAQTIEGLPDIRAPCGAVESVLKPCPGSGILQPGAGR